MANNLYFIFLVLGAWVLMAGTCEKNCADAPGEYQFVIPVSLTPALDTFRIGDTIHISSFFTKDVYERTTDRRYSLSDFEFNPFTRIVKIDTSAAFDALDNFNFIIPSQYNYSRFDASDGTQFLIGQYNYDDSLGYHLNYDIVVMSMGVYWLTHYPDIELNRQADFPGKCDLSRVSGVAELNENQDNNIELFESSPDPHFNEWRLEKPQERFYDGGSYAFVVIE